MAWVFTSMYHELELTKLEQFWNSTTLHCTSIPCIGAIQPLSYLSWLFLGGSANNLSCWKYVPVCTGTYRYVRPSHSRTVTVLYRVQLYRYVPVCTILPDPVQGYRIPAWEEVECQSEYNEVVFWLTFYFKDPLPIHKSVGRRNMSHQVSWTDQEFYQLNHFN